MALNVTGFASTHFSSRFELGPNDDLRKPRSMFKIVTPQLSGLMLQVRDAQVTLTHLPPASCDRFPRPSLKVNSNRIDGRANFNRATRPFFLSRRRARPP